MINFPVGPGNNPSILGTLTDLNVQRTPWGGMATLPLSVPVINDPSNTSDPANGGYTAFVNGFDPRSDFGPANPRNPNSKNYGDYAKQIPVYNLYLT